MGDTTNFSGDFRGAIVNFKSTLSDVQQTVGAIPTADAAEKAELARLIAELSAALDSLPDDKGEIAAALEQQTKGLVEEAKKETPNKTLLGMNATV